VVEWKHIIPYEIFYENYPLCKAIIDAYDEEMSKYVYLLDELGHLAIKWHNR
jgi:hypothetical protein